MTYTLEDGSQITETFDMAVLSVGMEASPDAVMLSRKLGIALNGHRFAKTGSFRPVTSSRDGIYVSGSFQASMAIPRSVTQASTAAAEASRALVAAKGTLTRAKVYPDERDISAEPPRIGVFVCACGINIANVVDVAAVAGYAKTLPNVVLVENNLFTCSTDTQTLIAARIKEHGLNRIVIEACTPRTHEPLFQDTLKEAGLNGHLIEMANIRNQNAWVHQKLPELATEKAKDQVRMAVVRASTDPRRGRELCHPGPEPGACRIGAEKENGPAASPRNRKIRPQSAQLNESAASLEPCPVKRPDRLPVMPERKRSANDSQGRK